MVSAGSTYLEACFIREFSVAPSQAFVVALNAEPSVFRIVMLIIHQAIMNKVIVNTDPNPSDLLTTLGTLREGVGELWSVFCISLMQALYKRRVFVFYSSTSVPNLTSRANFIGTRKTLKVQF
jgi:hypothetical protein